MPAAASGLKGWVARRLGRVNGQAWFVRRRIGYGWRPATWQGWVITFVFVGGAAASVIAARASKTPALFGAAVACIAVYAGIAALMSPRGVAEETADATGQVAPTDVPATSSPGLATAPRIVVTAPPRREPAPVDPQRPAALVVDGLTKRFRRRVAFDDVSFTVAAGEVFGFLGPNGAGKTTTVRTLGTLLEPSSGTASVAGIPLTPQNGQEIRQRIAIMPESPGLYLRLSVRENLEYFAGLFTIADPQPRIAAALEAVNMSNRANDLCGSLSKGLRQRVGLARSLLNDPEVLFLDEPTSGLDPVATREVHELIDSLRSRGSTVFLTTHRLDEAERLCDRVAILNTTLRMVGRPDELRAQLFGNALQVVVATPLADAAAVFDPVRGVERWDSDAPGHYMLTAADPVAIAPDVTRALVAADADVQSIGVSRHSLEDVYMQLVTQDVEASAR